jgi:hypothetical protein
MAMPHRQLDPAAAVFAAKFRDIDGELVHLAAICRVNLLDDDKVERVIRNDESVCASANHVAFEKLRELVLMHFLVRVRAVRAIGEEQTRTIIDEAVADIQHRLAVARRGH